jgi:quercetin dioxygenase-like cupin family protein
MIEGLPEIDLPIDGVRGKLLQGPDQQVVFFDIDPIGEIPAHVHGDQWGVVLEGEMDLTIAGQTRSCGAGDQYFIPAGAEHGATFRTRCRLIDVFADRDRYQAKQA